METWQPHRYLSRPHPATTPIVESPFHRFLRAVAWAFLVSLLTASPLILPDALLNLHSTSEDVWFRLAFYSSLAALLAVVLTPICLAIIVYDYNLARQASLHTPPLLTPKNRLLSRLGLAVVLAGVIGIVIAWMAAPDLLAEADKSKSDMNFGYLVPFFIPAPVTALLTLPIFILLSWPHRKRD